MALTGAVLVVDDDLAVRAALRNVLEPLGYAVLTAADGEEGLRVLRSPLPVGVVLLDVMMPVMNGLEMLEQKNADPALRDLPVFLLTAQTYDVVDPSVVQGVFAKPIDMASLVEALERLNET